MSAGFREAPSWQPFHSIRSGLVAAVTLASLTSVGFHDSKSAKRKGNKIETNVTEASKEAGNGQDPRYREYFVGHRVMTNGRHMCA